MKTNNLILIMIILSIGACKKQHQHQYKYNNPNELIECKYDKNLTCEKSDGTTLANGSAINYNKNSTEIAFFINGKPVATEFYYHTNSKRIIIDKSNKLFYAYHKNEKLSFIECNLVKLGSKSSIYIFDKEAEECLKKTKGNLTCEKLYECKFKEKWSI